MDTTSLGTFFSVFTTKAAFKDDCKGKPLPLLLILSFHYMCLDHGSWTAGVCAIHLILTLTLSLVGISSIEGTFTGKTI